MKRPALYSTYKANVKIRVLITGHEGPNMELLYYVVFRHLYAKTDNKTENFKVSVCISDSGENSLLVW